MAREESMVVNFAELEVGWQREEITFVNEVTGI